MIRRILPAIFVALVVACSTYGQESLKALSKPDGKAADQTKKVKVFILLGQSNMLGCGRVGPQETKGSLRLIKSLRKDFTAPNAKFVLATGCGNPGREGFGLKVAEAQLAIADPKKHPEFAGNVKAVDTRDLWREAADSPGYQGYHYNHNTETYMATGLRLGWAMAELLKGERK